MSSVTIKSAEIVNSLFLKYKFKQSSINSTDDIGVNSDAPIHDDLRNAFRQLIPHFCFICEEVTDEKLVEAALASPEKYLEDRENADDESFFDYRVIAFDVKQSKGIDYLTISGAKKLTNGDEIYFSTPGMIQDASDYRFSEDLQKTIEKLKVEVEAYMQGKRAAATQLEMFDVDAEEVEENAL